MQLVHQQYQYLMQQAQYVQYHQPLQHPIHHHVPPPLEQDGLQDQPSHLNHQEQQAAMGMIALGFPTPPMEAGELNHPPEN